MPSTRKPTSDKKTRSRVTDNRERVVVRSELFHSIYCNNVQLQVTPWDFDFRLGHILEATDKVFRYTEDVQVFISPQHTKALFKLIGRQLKDYEQKFGEIPDIEAIQAIETEPHRSQ